MRRGGRAREIWGGGKWRIGTSPGPADRGRAISRRRRQPGRVLLVVVRAGLAGRVVEEAVVARPLGISTPCDPREVARRSRSSARLFSESAASRPRKCEVKAGRVPRGVLVCVSPGVGKAESLWVGMTWAMLTLG